MRSSAKGSAAHTAADLDAMDDKLRRLGLDVAHGSGNNNNTAPSAAAQGTSNEDYLRRIRAAKSEKRQAQFDRVSRQAIAVEKQHTVQATGRASGAQAKEETLAADKALLASDAADAAVRVRQEYEETTTQQIRAKRALKSAQASQQQHQQQHELHLSQQRDASRNFIASASTQPSMIVSAAEPATWSSTAVARAEARRRAIAPWCAEVAHGVVELAMEVSDNRHLPATGLAGRPVHRLQQDLGVTQWREWVEHLVFAPAAAAAAEAAERAAAAAADGDRRGSSGEAATRSAEDVVAAAQAQAVAESAALRHEALRCIEAIAQAEAEEAAEAQQQAVAAVLATLHTEVSRQRRTAEEAVRREADRPHLLSAAPTHDGGGPTLVSVQREEVLPGWAQRMPPAGCLVFGDDLSGARLLGDTVELCQQRSLYAAQQQQQQHAAATTASSKSQQHHAAAAAAAAVAAGAAAADTAEDLNRTQNNEPLDGTVSNASFGKNAPPAAPPATAESPFAHFVATDVGVESGEAAVEGGVRVTYVTPKTLIGAVDLASGGGGGDNRRSGSASRGPRSQQAHGASSTTGAAGGNTQSAVTGGGGGGSAVRGGRRASAAPNDGRRSVEQQLADAAVKEVVRVHRHNLGVLVGDKIPGFAPAVATASTASTPPPPPPPPPAQQQQQGTVVPPTTAVVEEKAAEVVRAPLQTIFFVGFPESASFAEYFADRLRTAAAAAETELLEAEARRRTAEQQLVATAAAESGKPRSPSTKSAKGAAGAPSRQKANKAPKSGAEAEEGAVSAIVDQLRLTCALPPLSVLAVSLVYDLPTRQRRLESAAYAAEPSLALQRGGGGGDGGDDDLNSTFNAAAASGDFLHPIYHPWKGEEREALPSRTGSFRRPVGGAASITSVAAPTTFPASAALPAGYTRYLDKWNVSCLRSELEQQDARQHQQRQTWQAAVTAALAAKKSRDAANSELRRVPASFYAAGKRRDKAPGSTAQDADKSVPGSRRGSLTGAAAKSAESAGVASPASSAAPSGFGEAGTKPSQSRLLPRALFFTRVVDVSDATAPTAAAVDAAADAHALGRAVWRSSASTATTTTTAAAGLAEQLSVTARAATVDHVLTHLHLLCRPAGGRALSADALVPQQLPEPFRLGDYRLTDAVCARLRQVHDVYASLLPDPSSSAWRSERAESKMRSDTVMWAASEAVTAETAAWGAVMHYAEDLFSLIARDVFAAESQPARGDGPPRSAAALMNSTAHFTGIDQSYVRAKDAIAQRTARAEAHISDCLALLLRYSVDVCVAQLAASVRLFCGLLGHPSSSRYGGQVSSPTSCTAAEEDGVEAQLLKSAPGLPQETARELLAMLPQHLDRAGKTSGNSGDLHDQLCARLSQVYWPAVKTAAVEVMTQFFDQSSVEPLGETVTMEGLSSEDLLDSSYAVLKPSVQVTSADNLSVVADRLIAHATAAPAPLTRLALLLQELQHKTGTLREGAEAWVESLYHDVLASPPGATIPPVGLQRRPRSISQLADGPDAVLGTGRTAHASPAKTGPALPAPSWPLPSRWRCGELEVFLRTMPSADAAGLVTAASFQRGLLLNQLPRLWRFLPDRTRQLARQVRYTQSGTAATGRRHDRSGSEEKEEEENGSDDVYSGEDDDDTDGVAVSRQTTNAPLTGTESPHGRPSLPPQALATFPDTALDAYLVYDCPCKPLVDDVAVPFLTVENVQRLIEKAAGECRTTTAAAASTVASSLALSAAAGGGLSGEMAGVVAAGVTTAASAAPTFVGKPSFLYLSQWLVDVALGRCCFCAHGACHTTTATTTPAAGVRRATRRVIAPPSSQALRQTLLTLPTTVLEQVSQLDATTQCGTPAPSSALSHAMTPEMCAGWMQTLWWWTEGRTGGAEPSVEARRDVALCWALWRILRSTVLVHPSASTAAPGKGGPAGVAEAHGSNGELPVPRTDAAAVSVAAAAPSLLLLMRLLLVGAAGASNPREERVRRAFHCLAALRCVREGRGEESLGPAEENVDGVSVAMFIEDQMTLTADEYVLLGALLDSPLSQVNGDAASHAAASVAKGTADLLTDVQLLLQVENTSGVTLPLLLSSRWSQLLLAAHF